MLEERIARLERQNLWMKCAAVVLVGLFVTLGQSKPQDTIKAKHIEAQSFTLLGRDGKVWGEWKTSRNGPAFYLASKGIERSTIEAFYDLDELRPSITDSVLGASISLWVRTDDSIDRGSHLIINGGFTAIEPHHRRKISLTAGGLGSHLRLESGPALSRTILLNAAHPEIRCTGDQGKTVFKAP